MRRILGIALCVAWLPALGAECDLTEQPSADAYVTEVASLASLHGCFGRANDSSALTRKVLTGIDAPAPPMRTTDEVLDVRNAATGWLSDIELSFDTISAGADATWMPLVALMRSRLSEARLQVKALDATAQATSWELGDLEYFDGALDLKAPIRQSCATPAAPACRAGVAMATEVVRHAELVHAVLNKVLAERRLVPLYNEVSALDQQWDQYFEKGRSQYIWELGLNSWLYRKTLARNALAGPPDGQWILLHPGAAVEYAHGATTQSDLHAVAIVELVGYNRLWHQGSLLRDLPLGVSAITTVSLDGSGKRIGWGGMVHVRNRFSLGVARRDVGNGMETTWLMSTDLGALFLNANQRVRDQFRFGTP